jgi:DNA-directed RNA polymerase specialized sigma24 family protein
MRTAQTGGVSAADFDRLVRDVGPRLVRWLRRYTDQPEDAAAHAWEVLWRHRARIDVDGAIAYVHVVARHEAYRLGRSHAVDVAELIPDPRDAYAELEAMDLLDRLPWHQRTALVARALGIGYDELAEQLGRTYTWVNRHTAEGRAAVRRAA